jgi:radical SAM protein with 4Fe4S-binding SPASM domain
MAFVEVNSNFHTIAGKSVLDGRDEPAFREYRKKWLEWPKNFHTGEFPLHLDIEASSICNLNCTFCATSHKLKDFERGTMDFKIYKKIIDEGAGQGLCAIKFNSGMRGEPLINKSLPEMIAYAKQKGIMDVYFNTNAMLLTEGVSEKIIQAGLDRISISFDGTTPEVYEKHRKGASYEKVVKNIENLIKLRESRDSVTPRVRVQTVALPNLDLEEYKKFWGRVADEVAFIDFKDYSEMKTGLVGDWACPYIWQRLMITWEGKIRVCGFDYTDDHHLGNVNKGDSVKDAWRSEEMERIRGLHKKGRSHEIRICNGCSFRTTELLKLQSEL